MGIELCGLYGYLVYGVQLLPFVNVCAESSLVRVVVEVMGDIFPELRQYEVHISNTIAVEEASFGRTLLHVSLNTVACAHDTIHCTYDFGEYSFVCSSLFHVERDNCFFLSLVLL